MTKRWELRRRLTALFWERFFENDWSSSGDGLRFLLISTGSLLASLYLLLLQKMFRQYFELHLLPSRLAYENAVAGDRAFLIVVVSAVAAFLCVLRWRSLYPDATDLYVLGPMPVPTYEIYGARLASVAACVGCFVVGMSAAWAIVVPAIQQGRHSEAGLIMNVFAMFLACAMGGFTVMFALVALEGVLQSVFGRYRRSVSAWVQNSMLVVLIVAAPQILKVMQLGPVLRRSIGYRWEDLLSYMLPYFGSSLAACLIFYGLGYLQRGRLLDQTARKNRFELEWPVGIAGTGAARGLFQFLLLTLGRSAVHKTLLSAWLGLAAMMTVFEWTAAEHLGRSSLMFVSLAVPFWLLNGLSHAFEIPAESRANWIFRMLPSSSLEEANWMALRALMLRFCVAILCIAAAYANWRFHTLPNAVLLTIFESLLILSLAEVLLSKIDFVPFTAAYAPGERPAIQTVVTYVGAFFFFATLMGELSLATSGNHAGALLWGGVLLTIWSRLAIVRIRKWQTTSLRFGDDAEPEIRTLGLNE